MGVDLLFDDGSRLSDVCDAVLAPKADPYEKKRPAYGWRSVTLPLGEVAQGRTIKAVLVAFATERETRFAAYLDDIVLEKKA